MKHAVGFVLGLGLLAGIVAVAWVFQTQERARDVERPEDVVIGPDTTRLTAPLSADGRVDYAAALNEAGGPPAAENAALPALAILGTDVLRGDRDAVLRALGAPVDLPAIGTWVAEPEDFPTFKPMAEWEDAERATASGWLEANRPALDALVETSRRPRLWSPVVRDPDQDVLVSALPPAVLSRTVVVLGLRADARLVQGDLESAWTDVEALLRWQRLLDQQPGMLARMGGNRMRREAIDRVGQALASGRSDEAFCGRALESLRGLPEPRTLADDLDRLDRFFVLDSLLTGQGAERLSRGSSERRTEFARINSALQRINVAFDEFVVLLRVPSPANHAQLKRRSNEMSERTKRLATELKSPMGIGKAILEEDSSGGAFVGGHIGDMLADMALIPVPIFLDAQLACERQRRRVVLALAVRLHALRHGALPATAAALVPALLDALPTDPRDGKPISYELTDEGGVVGSDDDGITIPR